MTTDATAITINTEAVGAGEGASTVEFTLGDITDAVLESISITTGANSDASVSAGTLTTTSAEFTGATINVGAGSGSSLVVGEIIANSATTVGLSVTVGDNADLQLGSTQANSFTSANVTIGGTLGNQSTLTSGTKIVTGNVVSNIWTAGAGTSVTLPTVEVGAASGTIGATSLTSGIAGQVAQTIGATITPASIGAVTLAGSGSSRVVLSATAAATTASGASSQGDVSAAGMTSSLATTVINASASVGKLSITGSAGADTISSGTLADTIDAGLGADKITLQAVNAAGDTDVIRIATGDSNPVVVNLNNNDTGSDIIEFMDGVTAGKDVIEVTGVSTDATWAHTTHVKIGLAGTGGNSTNVGDLKAYAVTAMTIQFGDHTSATDPFDIVFNGFSDASTTGATESVLQTMVAVNLTGTSAADTLTMGINNDTVTGGFGADIITPNAGADVIDGGAGSDIIIIAATADSSPLAGGDTAPTGMDTITIGSSTGNTDVINLNAHNSNSVVDAVSATAQAVTLAAGAESTAATWTAAIHAQITGAANEVSIVKVTDNTTDTSADGNFSGYWLVANDGIAAIAVTDTIIKLVGITDTTTLAVSGTDLATFS
jgi:hypothetical protein